MSKKAKNKRSAYRHIISHICRRIIRSMKTTAQTVILTAVFVVAFALILMIKLSYSEIIENSTITANFVGGLSLQGANMIHSSDYTDAHYYEQTQFLCFNFLDWPRKAIITNDIARAIGASPQFLYHDNIDEMIRDSLSDTIIIGKGISDWYGYNIGDNVLIMDLDTIWHLRGVYCELYMQKHPEHNFSEAEAAMLYMDEMSGAFVLGGAENLRFVTIVDILTTQDAAYDYYVFMPGTRANSNLFGLKTELETVEFTLSDNLHTEEFRSFVQSFLRDNAQNDVSLVMDTSKLDSVSKSMKIINALYPITIACALLICALINSLSVLHSIKDAAIMRSLGSSKKIVRTVMTAEQCLLCIIGILLGICAIIVLRGTGIFKVIGQLAVFSFVYFLVALSSSMICIALSTGSDILTLLQARE